CGIPVPSSRATSGREGRYISVVIAPSAPIEPRSRTHLVIEMRRARAAARTYSGAVLVSAVIECVSPGVETFRVPTNFATVRPKSKRFGHGLWRESQGRGSRPISAVLAGGAQRRVRAERTGASAVVNTPRTPAAPRRPD